MLAARLSNEILLARHRLRVGPDLRSSIRNMHPQRHMIGKRACLLLLQSKSTTPNVAANVALNIPLLLPASQEMTQQITNNNSLMNNIK